MIPKSYHFSDTGFQYFPPDLVVSLSILLQQLANLYHSIPSLGYRLTTTLSNTTLSILSLSHQSSALMTARLSL